MADEKQVETAGVVGWIDERFPLTATWKAHAAEYYAPKNFNFWYVFGVLSLLVLVIQFVTGIFLVMHYKPSADLAFDSVNYIMYEVPWGWLIRYMHSTGASMFFVVVYLHMVRGLLYGSYRKPRELVWIFGVAIFLALMAEAFMGYLLPWGQMSYWGAQVIVNLFSAIPFIGPDLSLLIRGDYIVSDATLNRFFALHVIAVPLVLLGLVVAHLIALHEVGSNNPDGVEIKSKKDALGRPLDGIPFHPYYTVHDTFAVAVFLIVFSAVVFFAPEMGGYFLEYNNFMPADPLVTPPHIAPVWYFTAFYSMLRATTDTFTWILAGAAFSGAAVLAVRGNLGQLGRLIVFAGLALSVLVFKAWNVESGAPYWVTGIALVTLAVLFKTPRPLHGGKSSAMLVGTVVLIAVGLLFRVWDAKFWGVLVMGGAVVILFFLPWLDHSPVRSIRYRPTWHKVIYGIFFVNFAVLCYYGTRPPGGIGDLLSQIGTVLYLGFFILMPVWSKMGQFKQVPERVTFRPH